ncbi:MAG: SAVED domain-containing protein [Candidatus Hydrothermia bacterium]
MFRFIDFKPEHLTAFIRNGVLDTLFDELLSGFWNFYPDVQFEIVKRFENFSKKDDLALLLVKHFEIPFEDARKLINGPRFYFKIPAFFDDILQFVDIILIPETSRIMTNFLEITDYLEIIGKCCGKKFFIFFDKFFDDESFMLQVATVLRLGNVPDRYWFLGAIDGKCNILPIKNLDLKLPLMEIQGKRGISYPLAKNVRDIERWLKIETHHIPILIIETNNGDAGDLFANFLGILGPEAEASLGALKALFGIDEDNLIFVFPGFDGREEWWEKFSGFCAFLRKVEGITRGRMHFHFGIKSSPGLAMALGILFGSMIPFSIYDLEKLKLCSVVSNVRELKTRVPDYKIRHKFELKNQSDAIVYFRHREASDLPIKKIQERLDLMDASIVSIYLRGKLSQCRVKYVEVVKGVTSFIQDLRKVHPFGRFHFFPNIPATLSFLLGVSLGHYMEGVIYNFNRFTDSWGRVLTFSDLKRLRERS